eukprot:364496-Chlamydomonas_euryale.AAC.50
MASFSMTRDREREGEREEEREREREREREGDRERERGHLGAAVHGRACFAWQKPCVHLPSLAVAPECMFPLEQQRMHAPSYLGTSFHLPAEQLDVPVLHSHDALGACLQVGTVQSRFGYKGGFRSRVSHNAAHGCLTDLKLRSRGDGGGELQRSGFLTTSTHIHSRPTVLILENRQRVHVALRHSFHTVSSHSAAKPSCSHTVMHTQAPGVAAIGYGCGIAAPSVRMSLSMRELPSEASV